MTRLQRLHRVEAEFFNKAKIWKCERCGNEELSIKQPEDRETIAYKWNPDGTYSYTSDKHICHFKLQDDIGGW